jgi:hypothetical protein
LEFSLFKNYIQLYSIALFYIVTLQNCNGNNLIKIEDDIQAMKLELDNIKDKLEVTVEQDELHEIKEQADDNSKRCQKCF